MCIFLMIRRPPRSTQGVSSAASDVYKRQILRFYLVESSFLYKASEHIRGLSNVNATLRLAFARH
ncbi:hypothetical protein, partial [Staphylococcus aureus]